MRRDYQKGKVFAIGRDIYIGIDVHKENWHITARVSGEEVFHGNMLSEYQSLRKFLERFKGSKVKVAYEAGPCGFGLYDKLTNDGIETIVVPPSLIPVESGNKVKTDKRDSRKLAKLLESNMLKKVYVLSEEDRVTLMSQAWGAPTKRQYEEIELIDIKNEDDLTKTWVPFIHTHHYRPFQSFYESTAAHYPRRSCEALWAQLIDNQWLEPPCEVPFQTDFLSWLSPLIKQENAPKYKI